MSDSEKFVPGKRGAAGGEDGAGGSGPAFPPVDDDACPVTPLGHRNGTFFFLTMAGEFRALRFGELRHEGILALFGGDTEWLNDNLFAVDEAGNRKPTFSVRRAQVWLMSRSTREGLFDPNTPVRGTGVWRCAQGAGGGAGGAETGGQPAGPPLVVHVGDGLLRWGAADEAGGWAGGWIVEPPGARMGGVLYGAAPRIARPAAAPAGVEAGRRLHDALGTWSYRHSGGRELVAGYIGVSLLGAAPHWRAHAGVNGPRGCGKSSLAELVAAAQGDQGHGKIDQTTEAGLRQMMTGTARGVVLDEQEGGGLGALRAEQVVELIRLMSGGGSGGRVQRGSLGGEAKDFRIVASVFVAMIQPPPMKPQDRSRITLVELRPLTPTADGADRVRAALAEAAADSAGLRARAVARFGLFEASLGRYRAALIAAGHDVRLADQFATLLAGRDLLIHDAPADADSVAADIEAIAPFLEEALVADAEQGEGEEAWMHLTTTAVDVVWSGGERETVGMLLGRLRTTDNESARRRLGMVGVRYVSDVRAAIARRSGIAAAMEWPEGPGALVANGHGGLDRVFAGTRWERKRWREALRYLPGARAWPEKERFAGVADRCTLIPAGLLPVDEGLEL